MYYTTTMESATFEAEKNRKAFIYTVIICVIILLLAFLIAWPATTPPPPPFPEDLIEIDLGAAEGPIEPTLGGGGSPASAPQVNKQTDKDEDAAQQDASDDDNDKEAAQIVRNTRPSPSKNVATKQITNPPTVIKKPAIVMPSTKNSNPGTSDKDDFGKGPGKGPGEGPGTGPGKGGGAGGSGGAGVVKGVKPLNLGSLRFEDDFTENAKVYIDVRYNNSGTFTSATVVRPTTTSNSTILRIAREKVRALKFPPSDEGGITTILLNFKVN